MKRLSLLGLCLVPSVAFAQTARDTAHVKAVRSAIDTVTAGLKRYCATQTPQYMRAPCRQYLKLAPAESTLIAAAITPPPPPPSGGIAVAPELPRVIPRSRDPYPGRACSITVAASGDVSAALGAARGGSVVCLAGVYGPVQLPARVAGDTGFIVLRSAASLPAEGTRVDSLTATQSFAKIITPTNATPALTTAHGAWGYVVRGVEIGTGPSVTLTYALVDVGDVYQTDPSQQVHDLIIAQSYIHGSTLGEMQRCIQLNAKNVAIVDSYVSECHGKGYDAQAIGGWNGTGPYLISNNYLAGSGENILFGGAQGACSTCVASDVTITRNWIHTPDAWANGRWTKKLLLELKVAHRVLVEGNVLDGSWADGQTGYGIWIKSSCDAPVPNYNTTDVTVRLNRMYNTAAGIAITGRENYTNPSYITLYPNDKTQRIRIENNYVDSVNTKYTGDNRLFLIGAIQHGLADIAIVHNTVLSPTSPYINAFTVFTVSPTWPAVDRFQFDNNLVTEGQYGAFADGGLIGAAAYNAATTPYTFLNNAIVHTATDLYTYPATTTLVSSASSAPSTAGANVSAILAATAGVVQTSALTASQPVSALRIPIVKP